MNKDNEEVKKELEKLEKLIEEVKKQNEKEKHKQVISPKKKSIRINIFSVYSGNIWLNYIFSLLVNFIVIFSIIKIFAIATVSNDINLVFLSFIFTGIEEVYKKILFKKKIHLIIFTSGLIFFFINLVIFYILDLFLFQEAFSFVDPLYAVGFIILFQLTRSFIRNLYFKFLNISFFKR